MVPSRRRASVSVRIARSASACARPRPSASASARFANTTVSHSQIATVNVNQAGSFPPPSGSPPKTWISHATVVITAPISTTNITGLRMTWRGSSLRKLAITASRTTSRFSRRPWAAVVIGRRLLVDGQVQLEHVHARLPEHAQVTIVGVVVDQLLDSCEWKLAHGRDPPGLDARVGLGDVRVDARRRRGDSVDGHVGRLQAGVVGALEGDVGVEVVAEELRQLLVVRPEVVEEGDARVVAGDRRAALEVTRVRLQDRVAVGVRARLSLAVEHRLLEVLPDQLRADHLAVPLDAAPVGLAREDHLSDPGRVQAGRPRRTRG